MDDDKALEQRWNQGGCESPSGDIPNSPGHVPLSPASGDPALGGGVGLDDLRRVDLPPNNSVS